MLVVGQASLVVCRYTDFLGRSVDSLAADLRLHPDVPAVSLLLPIGISFYTFKPLSYMIEVRGGRVPLDSSIGFMGDGPLVMQLFVPFVV